MHIIQDSRESNKVPETYALLELLPNELLCRTQPNREHQRQSLQRGGPDGRIDRLGGQSLDRGLRGLRQPQKAEVLVLIQQQHIHSAHGDL